MANAKRHYHVMIVGSTEVLPGEYSREMDAQDALADLEYDHMTGDYAVIALDDTIPEYTIVIHDEQHNVIGEVECIV